MIFRKSLKNRKAVSVLLAGMAFLFFSCQALPLKKSTQVKDPFQDNYIQAVKEYREGNYERAVESLGILLNENPEHPEAAALKNYLISSLYYTGKYQDALTNAITWLQEYPDNPERYSVQKISGLSSRKLGYFFDAFFWMLKSHESAVLLNTSKSERDDISEGIKEIIHDCSLEDLNGIIELSNIEPYQPDIYYKLASIYLLNENLSKSRHYAALLLDETNDINWKSKAELILADINKIADVRRNAIGCLLPLKGSYSLYGKELLKGIQLGMEIFDNRDGLEPIELIIKNTNGEEADTLSAIDELVNNEKVLAIIGPLASIPSSAAGRKAQASGVPIITFTQRQGITEEGDMVFRNFLTPSKEVEAVLKKAVHDMGMTRFGIFHPDTPYGRYFMNLFWDRVEEMGSEITAVESYLPVDTDFTDGIKKMTGLYYPRPESIVKMLEEEKRKEDLAKLEDFGFEEIVMQPEQLILIELVDPECPCDLVPDELILAEFIPVPVDDGENTDVEPEENAEAESEEGVESEEEEEEPEPIDDFDAVFIPDNPENIALIAPQFPFNDIYNIPYLGTSLWMSDELMNTTAEYIQGAVFPTGFYVDNDSTDVSEFVRLYNESYGEDPGILAASGYDTIKLIRHILSNMEIITRSDFRKALMKNDEYTGITGKISFDEDGEVEKDPVLLTVHGRNLHTIQLNPPPPDELEPSLEDDFPQESMSAINNPDTDSPSIN